MEASNSNPNQVAFPFNELKPDEIDFSNFAAYPNDSGDKEWLVKVWNDQMLIESGNMEPLTNASKPLFSRAIDMDGIRDVWVHNLLDEFRIINGLVVDYPFVAMDTEFPGVVFQPYDTPESLGPMCSYQYKLIRCNVDVLRIIQLGLTLMDAKGNTPPGPCHTWQFNFKFNIAVDLFADSSIRLLQRSGVQFDKLVTDGIEPNQFAELLIGSGLVLLDNVTWISFHASYDFGYLLKLLTGNKLPTLECEFFDALRTFFPNFYDVKYLMQSYMRGGLQDLAKQLQIERKGIQHQAGSDAHLTGKVFFKLQELYFNGCINPAGHLGYLYGLDNFSCCGEHAAIASTSAMLSYQPTFYPAH